MAVGDRVYDPTIEINMAPLAGKQKAICYAYTGWWVVNSVEISRSGKEMHSFTKTDPIIHAVISVFNFDWDSYTNQEISQSEISRECQEFFDESNFSDNGLAWLNMCADFSKHPELLVKVCK